MHTYPLLIEKARKLYDLAKEVSSSLEDATPDHHSKLKEYLTEGMTFYQVNPSGSVITPIFYIGQYEGNELLCVSNKGDSPRRWFIINNEIVPYNISDILNSEFVFVDRRDAEFVVAHRIKDSLLEHLQKCDIDLDEVDLKEIDALQDLADADRAFSDSQQDGG